MQCIIAGIEVGENGTPHLQGYVQLTKRHRLSWLKNLYQGHTLSLRGLDAMWMRETIARKKEIGMRKEISSTMMAMGQGRGRERSYKIVKSI